MTADWFTALNAPKGLRSFAGTLWVADLDEVIGIDIASAKENARVKIDGAKFLNDVAVGADGTVYVSDMMASRIYAIKDGKATVFAEGEQLEYPNGLFAEGERLVVGGWGSKPAADFSTKVPGQLYCARSEDEAEDAHHQAAARQYRRRRAGGARRISRDRLPGGQTDSGIADRANRASCARSSPASPITRSCMRRETF